MTAKRLGRSRVQWLAGLVVALMCAGFLSFYASSFPDGLEFVAEEHGFAQTATESVSADGPLADYQIAGIDDVRLSGGLAGVAGSLVVLALSMAVMRAVRRPRVVSNALAGGGD